MQNTECAPIRHSIMVIEREPVITGLVRGSFAERGYGVSTCDSVSHLLSTGLDTDRYCMLILDLDTDIITTDPGMRGVRLITTLKDDPDTQFMPLLAISTNHGTPHLIASLEAGADDYVNKPVAPRELLARLSSILRRFN